MTNKTVDRTDPERPKKMPGWFSWRHQTRDAHEDAVTAYTVQHGRKARKWAADARAASSVPCVNCPSRTSSRSGMCSTCQRSAAA